MIGALALTWAIVVAAVSGVAIVRAYWARRRRPVDVAGAWKSMVVLRPCAGLESGLAEALESSRHASAIGARVRFLVARDDDAAAPIASTIAERLRAEGLDVVARTTHAGGPNGKCAQLAAALADDEADLVIVADSDVRLGATDLPRLLCALGATHAAAWAAPVEAGAPRSIGDRASQALLRGSLHAFVLLGQLDRGALVGKLVAIDRGALESIGGFAALVGVLGEDMELARRLRAAGRSIVAAPVIATSLASGRAMRQAIDRYRRWVLVIRAQRALLLVSYPLLIGATPWIGLLAIVGAAASPVASLSAAAVALSARLAVAIAASALSRVDGDGAPSGVAHGIVDAVLGDTLLSIAWMSAIADRRLTWRGRALRIGRAGRLETIERAVISDA